MTRAACFYVLVVTDARTGLPVPDATVTLVLDKGAGEPDVIKSTGMDGAAAIWINEPDSAWATLTIKKNGYQTWATQFQGSPHCIFIIRLEPEATVETEQKN